MHGGLPFTLSGKRRSARNFSNWASVLYICLYGSGGFRGQATDILIHAEEIKSLKRRLNEIYVHHTGNDYDTIEKALERDNFMSADKAKEFGLIDKVVSKRVEDPAEPKAM